MTDIASDRHHPAPSAEVVGWFGAIAVVSLLVPGLPILGALVLAFTRLRGSSPAVRIGLLAFAVAILVLQTIGLQGGSMQGTTGPAIRVG